MEPRIQNMQTLLSVGNRSYRKVVLEILEAGLQDSDPYNNTKKLISVDGSDIQFDMTGDGKKNITGWVAADDGMLALDRNGNGEIDDITEISFVEDMEGAESNLQGLVFYDTNGDGFRRGGRPFLW